MSSCPLRASLFGFAGTLVPLTQGVAHETAGDRFFLALSLRSGGAGTYRVNWRALSVDSHTSDGSFTFQVGQ